MREQSEYAQYEMPPYPDIPPHPPISIFRREETDRYDIAKYGLCATLGRLGFSVGGDFE